MITGSMITGSIVALVTPDGVVRQVADDLAFPNGMAVTPDSRTLVVAESHANRLTAFDIAADGSLANRRFWAETGDDHPDGICLDAGGQALGGIWHRVVRADVPFGHLGRPSFHVPAAGGTPQPPCRGPSIQTNNMYFARPPSLWTVSVCLVPAHRCDSRLRATRGWPAISSRREDRLPSCRHMPRGSGATCPRWDGTTRPSTARRWAGSSLVVGIPRWTTALPAARCPRTGEEYSGRRCSFDASYAPACGMGHACGRRGPQRSSDA